MMELGAPSGSHFSGDHLHDGGGKEFIQGGRGQVSNSRLWIYPCISGLADGSRWKSLLLCVSNDVRQVFSLFSVYRRIAGVMFVGCVCYADDVVPCQSALHVMLLTNLTPSHS